MNLLNKFYPVFLNSALKSDINYQLAAGVISNKKLVTRPCCNTNRNYCRGTICGSIHAEANALLNHYGKDLQFDSMKNRWCLLRAKGKEKQKS